MKTIYKVVPMETDGSVLDTEKFFNEFGATGWELQHIKTDRTDEKGKPIEDLCVFMKRVKTEEKKA